MQRLICNDGVVGVLDDEGGLELFDANTGVYLTEFVDVIKAVLDDGYLYILGKGNYFVAMDLEGFNICFSLRIADEIQYFLGNSFMDIKGYVYFFDGKTLSICNCDNKFFTSFDKFGGSNCLVGISKGGVKIFGLDTKLECIPLLRKVRPYSHVDKVYLFDHLIYVFYADGYVSSYGRNQIEVRGTWLDYPVERVISGGSKLYIFTKNGIFSLDKELKTEKVFEDYTDVCFNSNKMFYIKDGSWSSENL